MRILISTENKCENYRERGGNDAENQDKKYQGKVDDSGVPAGIAIGDGYFDQVLSERVGSIHKR
jgi:hypothetical protein